MSLLPYFQPRPRPVYERISLVVSLTLIGLALYFVVDLPTRSLTLQLFGTPLTFVLSQRWLMAALLGALASSGADAVVRAHPANQAQGQGRDFSFWVLPGATVILATFILALAPSPLYWAIGLGSGGLVLWLTIFAEYHTVDPDAPRAGYRLARLWLDFVAYGLALAFFLLIYQSRTRSALSATGTLFVSGALTLALLRTTPARLKQTWFWAGLIGLGIGQLTWALNYWRMRATGGGLVLLLAFYVVTGLARQELSGSLNRRAVIEFLGLGLFGIFVVVNFVA